MQTLEEQLKQSWVLEPSSINTHVNSEFHNAIPWHMLYLRRTPTVYVADDGEIASAIPTLKIGAKVGLGITKRILRDTDSQLLYEWRRVVAKRVVEGIRNRMNVLICNELVEGTIKELTLKAGVSWEALEATPIQDIRTFVKLGASFEDTTFNRITLSSRALRAAFNTEEFLLAKETYTKLFDITSEDSMEQNLGIFSKLVKLIVEVDDSTFRERNSTGETVINRVLPWDKVVFTNSANDYKADVSDFAIGILTEASDNFIEQVDKGQPQFGPVGYVTVTDREIKDMEEELVLLEKFSEGMTEEEIKAQKEFIKATDKQVAVWGVLRGSPRRHLAVRSGVLTI